MTPAQVDAVTAALPDVVSTESKEKKGASEGGRSSRKRTIVRFADDRFFSIEFSILDGTDQVSDLHLVYQNKSYARQTIIDVLAAHPNPDYRRDDGPVELFAWGGTRVSDGSVVPEKGIAATLLVEHLKGQHVDVALNRVRN